MGERGEWRCGRVWEEVVGAEVGAKKHSRDLTELQREGFGFD